MSEKSKWKIYKKTSGKTIERSPRITNFFFSLGWDIKTDKTVYAIEIINSWNASNLTNFLFIKNPIAIKFASNKTEQKNTDKMRKNKKLRHIERILWHTNETINNWGGVCKKWEICECLLTWIVLCFLFGYHQCGMFNAGIHALRLQTVDAVQHTPEIAHTHTHTPSIYMLNLILKNPNSETK